MANLKTGKIHDFTPSKGYGFISHEGETLFFHKSSVDESISLSELKIGTEVSFRFGKNRGGVCATDVQWTPPHLTKKTVKIKKKSNKVAVKSHNLTESAPQKWHEQLASSISQNQNFKLLSQKVASTTAKIDKEHLSLVASKAVVTTKNFAVNSLSFAGNGLLNLSKKLEK